eukprot:TRINITY_DN4417_c0_g1_i7.p1 TRINITY_DN4417_c0_g1~~TRINITY_DN4417_c0_g1_i7.p1  ORF type:complete len:307 (+),score=46.98 TRINITY_DN4417_c0_g1_i7:180-1100(+)
MCIRDRYKRIGGKQMSAATASRVSSMAHIYFQVNRNYRDMTGIDTRRTRWNQPAQQDIMLIVTEFERHSAFDVDPSRQDVSCIPTEWSVGGKVPPRYFNDWFTLHEGVGVTTTANVEVWLKDVLKPGYTFDYTSLGMEEFDDEDASEAHKCGHCLKPGATLVCAWCGAELHVYCNQRCRQADLQAHTVVGKGGFRAMCGGPGGSNRREAPSSNTEVGVVKDVIKQISNQFKQGEVDLEMVEELLEKMESDNFIANQCKDCLLYTSDAADEEDSVDLGGRRIIKKKKKIGNSVRRENIKTRKHRSSR